jgi:hypothetical protein
MTDGEEEREQAKKEAETLKRVRGLSHVGRYGNTGHEHTDIEQPALPGERPPVSPPVRSGRIPILRLIGHALPAGGCVGRDVRRQSCDPEQRHQRHEAGTAGKRM